MKENFENENIKIEYSLRGDYYISNLYLELEEKIVLNKYGLARLKFLKENRKAEYSILFIERNLNKHLKEIQEIAQEKVAFIIEQLKKKNNLSEDMKNTNQLYWIRYDE